MHIVRLLLLLAISFLPVTTMAGLGNGDLPVARWYCHVDLAAMRKGSAGKQLYAWLEREVFDELREDIGFDADREMNLITALATPEGGIMIVIDGEFTQQTKDRIIAVGAAASQFNRMEYGGREYYHVDDDDESGGHDHGSFDDGAFISVAMNDKLLITSSEQQMQALFDGKGRIPGDYGREGALIVLNAEQSLVQAGMSTSSIGDDLGWNSNMLKNTRQVAVVVADQAGKFSVEAQLIAAEAALANSLASIVRGLISLQVFNDDMDPELAAMLQSTAVTVDGATLTVRVAVDPATMLEAMD